MKKAIIATESDKILGAVYFTGEEFDHFCGGGAVPARICLEPSKIVEFGIDEDTYVYVLEP
ncbi:MAG: hypothetical protein WC567_03925 [Kiritimatiellia bacterium]|jgi:hypothetical protein